MTRGLVAILLSLVAVSSAHAMPWDVDMYRQQSLVPGEIARNPVKGTIPVGYKPWKLTTEEAGKLKNPVPMTDASVHRGKRVYNSNCVPCHGVKGDAVAPVGKAMSVPNLVTDFYANKTDGSVYGVLMNGGSAMPRYGYKFSEEDRWNVINYLRFLQGKKVQ